MDRLRVLVIAMVSVFSLSGRAEDAGLYLRDEVSGEWLIGILDCYAIYDNRVWNCEKKSGGSYELAMDGRKVEVSLKHNRAVIAGRRYSVSAVSGPFLPPYPSPSADSMAGMPLQRPDTVTFVCITRSRRPYYDYYELVDDSVPNSIIRRPVVDSLGRAVVRHATRRVSCLRLLNRADTVHGDIAGVMAYCNPGDTALLYIDDIDGRAYCMGSLSRVNNELLAARPMALYRLSYPVQTNGLDSALAAFGRSYAKSRQIIDSICTSCPTVSVATRQCLEAYCRFCYAFECLYKTFHELHDDVSGPLFREYVSTRTMPAVCSRVVASFASDYDKAPSVPSWAATAFRNVYAPMRFALAKGLVPTTECNVSKPESVASDTAAHEGKWLLEELVRPYRGKIVYIDLWGGWCGPCLAEMKHVQAVRDALRGEDVVFMYLANRTDAVLYRELVSRFGLDAPGSVTFNLPAARQNAIESYLKVSSFPSYFMIDRHGSLIDRAVPRPSRLDELKRVIEEVMDR